MRCIIEQPVGIFQVKHLQGDRLIQGIEAVLFPVLNNKTISPSFYPGIFRILSIKAVSSSYVLQWFWEKMYWKI